MIWAGVEQAPVHAGRADRQSLFLAGVVWGANKRQCRPRRATTPLRKQQRQEHDGNPGEGLPNGAGRDKGFAIGEPL
jgi:hypothetical protein